MSRPTHALSVTCPTCAVEMLRFEAPAHESQTPINETVLSSWECRACALISYAVERQCKSA